jgi:nucleotide-binding universal stress UspA family protein
VLARIADEIEADLIVMGSHGRRGVQRFLLGSVAESLVRATDKPVLIVRHDPAEHPQP